MAKSQGDNMVFTLDASGSMWGQLKGTAKNVVDDAGEWSFFNKFQP